MKNLLFLLLLILFSLNLIAQDPTGSVARFRLSSIYANVGYYHEYGNNPVLSDFNMLAPGSEFLKTDMSSYSEYDYSDSQRSFMLGAMAGFQIRNKDNTGFKKSPLFKAGILYTVSTPYGLHYMKNEYIRTDTLTSTSGATTYVDSVHYQGVNAEYNRSDLRFDISIIYTTNPEKRWSFYSGLGINFGWSFDNYTVIINHTQDYYSTYVDGSDQYSTSSKSPYNITTEYHDNKGGLSGSMYIPLGIDLRIARTGFLKSVHLFYEKRIGLSYSEIPEFGSISKFYNTNSIGLRVEF